MSESADPTSPADATLNAGDVIPFETPDAHHAPVHLDGKLCPTCGLARICRACNGTHVKITATATGTLTEPCPVCSV